MRFSAVLLVLAMGEAQAQNCPRVDPAQQDAGEAQCRAAGGEWARHGVHAHLCGVYSCAPRTKDGGKACRNRADCEHLCISKKALPIGTEVTGECTAVVTSFGCAYHVDGGKIVGRTCVE